MDRRVDRRLDLACPGASQRPGQKDVVARGHALEYELAVRVVSSGSAGLLYEMSLIVKELDRVDALGMAVS